MAHLIAGSRSPIRVVVIASVLWLASVPALAQSVAIVTDLSGKVSGPDPVTILSEIAADARLQVEPGGTLVVIYLKSGDEYTFTGPAQLRFRAEEPQVVQGARARKRGNPLGKGGKGVTIKPVGVAQAAYVMRSGRATARIKLLTLSGTRTLESSPEFRWQAIEPGLKYRFELTDDTGRSLHESELEATELRLPASIALREGASYTWEVSARAPDKRRYVSAGDFSIAPADVRAQARALRPAARAPVSDRVAYAAWLEQMELRDEARKYWQALSAERPGDQKLRALAAQ